MTASTSDPSDLPSLGEAIDIAITSDPLGCVITAKYPDGTWDVVYHPNDVAGQPGVFASRYANSSRAGSNFALRRAGGWPAGVSFDVKVKEETPAVTSFWSSVYDVDFSTLANQTIFTSNTGARSATPTIDGRTWDAFTNSNNGGTPSSMAVVNGSGLVMTNGGTISPFSGGSVTGPYISLPGANISGWNAAKQTCVMARVTSVALSVTSDAVMALSHTPGSINSARAFGKYSPSNGATAARWAQGYGLAPPVSVDDQPSGAIDHVLAVVRFSNASAFGLLLPWSGTWPVVEDLYGAAYITHTASNAGTSFGVLCGAGFGHQLAVTVKRMQVLQK